MTRYQKVFQVFFFIMLLLLSFSSCRTVRVLTLIQSENVDAVNWTNHEKTVRFLPMHHIGKQVFYDRVRDEVEEYKGKGYVVYYESAKANNISDPVELDKLERKFRKMMGFHLDTTGYIKHLPRAGIFLNLMDQPAYEDLSITSDDVRVDVSKDELVAAYEQHFGVIPLSDVDWKTPLEKRYDPSHRLPEENVFFVIITHRNAHLANYIHHSADKKILVVYGADHVKGTLQELKRRDPRWKKIKKPA